MAKYEYKIEVSICDAKGSFNNASFDAKRARPEGTLLPSEATKRNTPLRQTITYLAKYFVVCLKCYIFVPMTKTTVK